jgi:hypothetical protein
MEILLGIIIGYLLTSHHYKTILSDRDNLIKTLTENLKYFINKNKEN